MLISLPTFCYSFNIKNISEASGSSDTNTEKSEEGASEENSESQTSDEN